MPANSPANPPTGERRRRTHKRILSRFRSVVDWLIIFLLLACPLGGMVMFGAVTLWIMGPLLLLSLVGMWLLGLRPIWAPDARQLLIPPGGLALAVFFLYGLIRIPWAGVPYDARMEMIQVGSYLLAYWAWTNVVSHYHRGKVLLGVFIFAVSLICWYAIVLQSHGSHAVLFRDRPADYGMRASGTYICPNHFANLLEMTAPFCLALLFTAGAGAVIRLLSAYGLALIFPVLFLTQSRSGALAAVAGLSATGLLMAFRKNRKWFWWLLVLIPVIVIAASLLLWTCSSMVRHRAAGAWAAMVLVWKISPLGRLGSGGADFQLPEQGVEARVLLWRDTWQMIKDQPIFGRGPGNFEWFYPHYQSHGQQFWFDFAHNEVLQLTADYGVIGLALLGLALALGAVRLFPFIRTCERDRDAFLIAALAGSVLAGLVHAQFDFNFHIFANTHVLVFLAGVVAAYLFSGGPLKPRPGRTPARLALWISGLVLVLFLAGETFRAFFTDSLESMAVLYRRRVDLDKAAEYYRRSIGWDAGKWDAYLGLGEVLLTQGYWSLDPKLRAEKNQEARETLARGLARNPYHMEICLDLAQAEAKLGQTQNAVARLKQVADFAHHDLFYLIQVGLQLRRLGENEEAERVFERAQQLGFTDTVEMNLQHLRRFHESVPAPLAPGEIPIK